MSSTAVTYNTPLRKRMNKNQLVKREVKMAARQIAAERLQKQINGLGHYVIEFRQRGFWGRLKWLVTGK